MGTGKIYKHAADCDIWTVEVGTMVCSCKVGIPKPRSVANRISIIWDGIHLGFNTDEIAEEFGVKYGSLIKTLDRCGYHKEHETLKRMRAHEWEVRMQYRESNIQTRCPHGVWTSSEGECQHGKMGRKPVKRSAA